MTNLLNIALPKGRMGEKSYEIFKKIGYHCAALEEPKRKLVFLNEEEGVRYFWVKPSDVGTYVERGAADIGIVGKDILLENEHDIYELLNLEMGKCYIAVAGKKDFRYDRSKILKVATKLPNIANKFFLQKSMSIDIIHLNGSIEIAPLIGLSDVIVDIVETGTTLRENNLAVIDRIADSSARLIANKASYKFKYQEIQEVREKMARILHDENNKE